MNTSILKSELWQEMIEADNQVKNSVKIYGRDNDIFLSYDHTFKRCILALEDEYGKETVINAVQDYWNMNND